jgi:hypothetical protein
MGMRNWEMNFFSAKGNMIQYSSKLLEFFAKIAIWVKDGVPTQAREYTGGTARPSPESLSSNDTQVLARDKPWLYSAIREGFPCKHLS